ncbi:hypothetical protein XENTR_v10024245 [Xenopus tropicalis]|nr:hypothetical protein XENTR_v10024245 [Xenopus tropicalis]
MKFFQNLKEYIGRTAFPCLKHEEKMSLEEPIGLAELLLSIKNTPNGKAPVPEGYTALFYKMLKQNCQI